MKAESQDTSYIQHFTSPAGVDHHVFLSVPKALGTDDWPADMGSYTQHNPMSPELAPRAAVG